MANFCQQCSIDIFGEDCRDLANLGGRDSPPLEEGKDGLDEDVKGG